MIFLMCSSIQSASILLSISASMFIMEKLICNSLFCWLFVLFGYQDRIWRKLNLQIAFSQNILFQILSKWIFLHLVFQASYFACYYCGIGELTCLSFPMCCADGGWLLVALFYKCMHIDPLSLAVNGLLISCSVFNGTLMDNHVQSIFEGKTNILKMMI